MMILKTNSESLFDKRFKIIDERLCKTFLVV